MKEIVDKLAAKEREMAGERGPFSLFALFLREDAADQWDLVVSASWMAPDKLAALQYIAAKVQQTLGPEHLLDVTRIVVIDVDNPGLDALYRAVRAEHGSVEIRDSNFFGLPIKHAYLITCRRADEGLSAPSEDRVQSGATQE